MNGCLIIEYLVLLTMGLISICHSKVALKIRIYNYGNENDIKHDGWKCEALHWANDNCDPIFQICVTGQTNCDVLKYNVDHWRNKKFITTVLHKTVLLEKIQRSLSVDVRVDDHDKVGSHDHIATFNAHFDISILNHDYGKAMTVTPVGMSVVLYVTVSMQCQEYYYGPDCENLCKPVPFNYDCNTTSGERISALDCGLHGSSIWDSDSQSFLCDCLSNWSGDKCQFSTYVSCATFKCTLTCTRAQLYKHCTCTSDPNSEICQEILDPVTLPSRPTTIISTRISVNTDSSRTFLTNVSTTNSKDINTMQLESKNQSSFSPIAYVIIFILLLLCICVIALVIVIRNWRKKDKMNNTGFLKHVIRSQMPLPQVVYQPSLHNRNPGPFVEYTKSTLVANPHRPQNDYDQYTDQTDCAYEAPLIKFNHVPDPDEDEYEQPNNSKEIFRHNSDINDETGNDLYEEPRQLF